MKRQMVSVLAPDRVGLLCAVTEVVLRHGGNIGAIRQTIVGGYFSLVFVLEVPDGFDGGRFALELEGIAGVVSVTVGAYEPGSGRGANGEGSCFVTTLSGPDRPGTILGVSRFLVGHGVNIEDWRVEREGERAVYTARLDVPAGVEPGALREGLAATAKGLGLESHLCHENIIRATNEIGPIKSILE